MIEAAEDRDLPLYIAHFVGFVQPGLLVDLHSVLFLADEVYGHANHTVSALA